MNQNRGNNITGSYHALISSIEKEQYQKLSDDVRGDLCGFTASIGSVKSGNDRLNISYSNNDALTLNGLSVSEAYHEGSTIISSLASFIPSLCDLMTRVYLPGFRFV